ASVIPPLPALGGLFVATSKRDPEPSFNRNFRIDESQLTWSYACLRIWQACSKAAAVNASFAATTRPDGVNGCQPPTKRPEGGPGQRSCGAPCDPGRLPPRTDRRPRAGKCAGQSCHFAAGAGSRLPSLLPTQSKALPADRNVGAGRSA